LTATTDAQDQAVGARRLDAPTRFARHRGLVILVIAVLATLLFGATLYALRSSSSTEVLSSTDCLERENTAVISGQRDEQYKISNPGTGQTVDARNARFVSYPFETLYPLSLGNDGPGRHLCLIGGLVQGQQPRDLTWQQMKSDYDGTGARVAGNDWYVVDGLRVENVEDGVDPRGTEGRYPKDGDGFLLRNLYFQYIRDDCIENDDIAGGVIEDSLFDGCNTGISERPSDGNPQLRHPAPSDEELVLRNVLMRLEPMPGPRGEDDANVLGHGQLFKWSDVSNRLRIEDSIFLVEQVPNRGTTDFPEGTVAKNVTVVWLGGGAFPGRVPEGVRITTDLQVWETAKDRWLSRHGCVSFTRCDRLIDPSGAP